LNEIAAATSDSCGAAALIHEIRFGPLRKRYPLDLHVHYKVLRRGRVQFQGSGHTLNLGTDGALVETSSRPDITAGLEIVLIIDWPVLLGGKCPLRLMMRGRIAWRVDRCIAIRASEHEFRTGRVLPVKSVQSIEAHSPASSLCTQGTG